MKRAIAKRDQALGEIDLIPIGNGETQAGFGGFAPAAGLVNRYEPRAKLSQHQDRDELDLRAPIVSVSLDLPATFLFGGLSRRDNRAASGWSTATSRCGRARRGSSFMASRRSPTASIRSWAGNVSI
jgi:hypothetical protein